MATINRRQAGGNQNFKQIEGDGWLSTYLPAICAGTLMAVVLFVAASCSKKSDKQIAKISAPSEPAMTSSTPATPAAVPVELKKVKKHRPANATYVNSIYGVSFSYPRRYSLQSSDKPSTAPVQTSFLKPGTAQIASVDMPSDSYPETDFSSALMNVSVNESMTADECAQFVPDAKDGGTPKPETVKLGANQFAEFEQINGVGDRKSDLKYFHLFKNNACYEFALDVETSAQPESDLVDHGKVFQKLEKILTTARIKQVELPGMENTGKTTPADSTSATPPLTTLTATSPATDKAEKAQVVTPEQK